MEKNNKITGIGFIDRAIEGKGLIWWIRTCGWVGIISGCLDLILLLTIPLWKEQLLSRWRNDNLPLFLPQYNMYKYIFLAPLRLITGIGFLKVKQWARLLLIFTFVYYIAEIIITTTYEISVILPKYNQFHTINRLFCSIIGLCIVFFVIYIFTRPKVKEQFK